MRRTGFYSLLDISIFSNILFTFYLFLYFIFGFEPSARQENIDVQAKTRERRKDGYKEVGGGRGRV